jgi:REP element-mobilizing transposase RayT
MPNEPLAYFITFSCYGTWLHGDQRGSVDDDHNRPDTPFIRPEAGLFNDRRQSLKLPPYYLDGPRREVVLQAIQEIAERKQWEILAVHVRTNHVHIVVRAHAPIERVMNDFKTSASRRLKKAFPDEVARSRWTRHGSTIYLWSDAQVVDKVDYVLNRQGEPLARFPVEPRTQASV